jgi:hypothetical protein
MMLIGAADLLRQCFHPEIRGLDDELWLAERAKMIDLTYADAHAELVEREQDARGDWMVAGCPRRGNTWDALLDATWNLVALEGYSR